VRAAEGGRRAMLLRYDAIVEDEDGHKGGSRGIRRLRILNALPCNFLLLLRVQKYSHSTKREKKICPKEEAAAAATACRRVLLFVELLAILLPVLWVIGGW